MRFESNKFWNIFNNLVALKNLLKLIKLKRVLSLKLKNNLKNIVFLESKKDRVLNKINKSNLKFLI